MPPDGAPRGGQDGEVYFISYWYPQMAVYDDINGWQIDQYLGNAEFYMGYGDYDVSADGAGRLAGDRHRLAGEPRRRAEPPDPRPARLGVERHRHRARRGRERPRGRPVHHRRERRQAHLALYRQECARRGLGRLVAIPVGRHQRGRGRCRWRRPARLGGHLFLLPPRTADQSLGRGRALRASFDRVLLQVPLALSLARTCPSWTVPTPVAGWSFR